MRRYRLTHWADASRAFLAGLLGLLLCSLLIPTTATGEAVKAVTWSDVQGILAEHCVMCHGPQGAARGLHLDSYLGVMAGGDDGPVVLSGDADASELIRRLRGESLPRMPFLSYPLADDEIRLIALWVDGGLSEEK